ncbi:MAG: hypothetical protein AAEJ04_05510 [Planctomycetota bacterium]
MTANGSSSLRNRIDGSIGIFFDSTRGLGSIGLAILFLFGLLSTPVLAQEVNLIMDTSSAVLAPGETFEVTVQLENPGEISLQGIQHVVSWDSTRLQLLSVTLPGELEGSPPPQILAWNAPEPVGSGGDTGCSQWWDGTGTEAFSMGLVIDGEWTQAQTPLARLEMRILSGAPNQATTLSSPAPDFSCGWLGSIVTDSRGGIIATSTEELVVQISDLPRPSTFACAEANEIVYLSWSETVTYDVVRIERDGVLIDEISGGIGQYQDLDVAIGSTVSYSVSGFSSSTPTPPVSCSVVVDGIIDAPEGLTCLDAGFGVVLSWGNNLPYTTLIVNRQGSFLQTLPAGTFSFIDGNPILGEVVDYEVRGVLGGNQGAGSNCQVEIPLPEAYFIRGDVTTDGQLNLSDPVVTLQYLFTGADMPCASAADFDDSGTLDLGDGISLLSYLFAGGASPALPFPSAGTDPTPDGLGCVDPCPDPDCSSTSVEGDECLNAITIGLGNTNFDNTNMTNSPDLYDDLQCSGTFLGQMSKDIWFSFTAPFSGSVTISTCFPETIPDTDLVIYEGSCAAPIQIACNGDSVGCSLLARVQNMSVVSGTSYLIRVGGWDPLEFGSGILSITSD